MIDPIYDTLFLGVVAFLGLAWFGRSVWASAFYRLRRFIWEKNHPDDERI